MPETPAATRRLHVRSLRPIVVRHPVAAFLLLVYGIIAGLAFLPPALTKPGLLPGGATVHGLLENIVGSAVPAFVVTAIVSGRVGVRDLARRSLRWKVRPRWYLIALLAPPAALLVSVTALYGLGPLRALVQNWPLLLTSFLPTLAVMVVFNSVAGRSASPDSCSPGCKTGTDRCAPPWPPPSSSGSTTCQASYSTPVHGSSPPR